MTGRPRDEDPGDRMRRRETLIERQIREAMEDGRFDDLPHQGERLPLIDDSAAGEWAPAYRMLKNAGAAPDWIEADKEVRMLLDRRDALRARAPRAATEVAWRRDRADLERIVGDHNAAVARLNAVAPTVRQQRTVLSLADELDTLARLHDPPSGV